MKTKCFILILLSCLFFSLYSCGKSGEKNAIDKIDTSDFTKNIVEYEINTIDMNSYTKNGKYYLDIITELKNTGNCKTRYSIDCVYSIDNDTFNKFMDTVILSPAETHTINYTIKTDRSEIIFENYKVDTRREITLVPLEYKLISEKYHAGEMEKDCYYSTEIKLVLDVTDFLNFIYENKDKITRDYISYYFIYSNIEPSLYDTNPSSSFSFSVNNGFESKYNFSKSKHTILTNSFKIETHDKIENTFNEYNIYTNAIFF